MAKSKAPKQRPSAQEIALAENAVADLQRHEAAFRPLEQDAIRELQTADADKRSAMLAGRRNADLEQQATGLREQGIAEDLTSGKGASNGTAAMRGFRRASAVELGKDTLRAESDQAARDSIDQDTLNVIRTGQDQARGAQMSLTSSARLQHSEDASKLNTQFLKDQTRQRGLAQLVGTGIAGGYVAADKALGKHKAGPLAGGYSTSGDDLNLIQRGLRKTFGSEVAV